ncbi:MAG TPA: hypothetical protein VL221_00590 [Bacteroidota bacterium]|nr:hypothetical protein [Bacteroidota bacterium]
MRTHLLLALSLALLAGCATFKELEPKPELSPVERGYIELRNDKEFFELDQGKQYFIRFPRPLANNFAIVLETNAKWYLSAYMTRTFNDGKGPIVRIQDEAQREDSAMVYAVDLSSGTYFWVIDTVRQDIELRMRYRYVPRWRYTFENEYAALRQTLAANVVDRGTYTSAPGAPPIESVDFAPALASVGAHTAKLSAMNDELKKVADLFPPDISPQDTAYRNYAALRGALEEELRFQQDYAAALTVFSKEKEAGTNTGAFLADAPLFADFLKGHDRYPSPLVEKVKRDVMLRMNDVVPWYEQQLRNKRDVTPIVLQPPPDGAQSLYEASGRPVPPAFAALRAFVDRFNLEANGLASASARLKQLHASVDAVSAPPPASFYGGIEASARDIRAAIPQPLASANERYRGLDAASLLALQLGKAAEEADDFQSLFGTGGRIAAAIGVRAWGTAEAGTRDLYVGKDGRTYASVERHRDRIVRWFEADILNGVRNATKERLDAFVRLNQGSFANVPALYADSAFSPVYQLTFSAAGPAALARNRSSIDDYIDRVRHFQFPEAAIRTIYADFARDMAVADGVDRARAVVDHGKEYRGTDKQIAAIITECDPEAPKWVVRPKEYRRVLALPVTANRRGVNEYMFRLRLQIPSDAAFPVFDVNIKLPVDLAGSAGREQWYDAITINGKPIKNEGRYRITSPTADNGYESQITPVEMDKEGRNVLEVRFKKAAYRVYEISAMAQVPIMKKN